MVCSRIGDKCPNQELTISDANFIINILNYYYDSGIKTFGKFFCAICKFFNDICSFCAINQKFYVSNLLVSKELNPLKDTTIIKEGKIFKKFNKKRHKKAIECLFNKIIKICNLNDENKLNELIRISNDYYRSNKLYKIGSVDLSLFLLALKISNNYNKKVIIITDDTSFYNFIIYCFRKHSINLCGDVMNTEKVISVLPLLYIVKIYECCNFENFIVLWDQFMKYYRKKKNPIYLSDRLKKNQEISKEFAKSHIKKHS